MSNEKRKVKTANEITNRMNELNTTSVPFPFDCEFACEVDDCNLVEKVLHTGRTEYQDRTAKLE